ncbi:hypothetical protein HYPSUDRAFT_45209 [Hypholoma sublateritium FD-334 SS-4]|uniref:Secreted protein n=1 Tax=Hypholoma sublateritium (strain FD-334 SS-4) TaxID=945553 RepID=A0A0D2KUX2_HYPSF|nr:hypothetical protein HYPSUDRAFT_45209 [Hypholoma sublateritium FD-334 SS-4]
MPFLLPIICILLIPLCLLLITRYSTSSARGLHRSSLPPKALSFGTSPQARPDGFESETRRLTTQTPPTSCTMLDLCWMPILQSHEIL